MKIEFTKCQALGNDFLIIEISRYRFKRAQLRRLAAGICDRKRGVGADGVLCVSKRNGAGCTVDVFNADGSWAEKSGNGLRITAVHLKRTGQRSSQFLILMGGERSRVSLGKRIPGGYLVTAELGAPHFHAADVPVKSRNKYVINCPIKIGATTVTATCLSVGNPHAVIAVKDFDFDWKSLGHKIEHNPMFPNATNVEFVKVVNRRKIIVHDWERGAGATESSGTGAAAAVCAMVIVGRVGRQCEVRFETGSLFVDWRENDDIIELTGPVQFVMGGVFEWH